ncbi:MAG TPA: metal ABC transporter ATP-binding protein [Actinomycetaceae bacterium]|nr:metal ABC transporter ATP-binding protein [Actinomycetaceae bacterium]
MPLGPPPVATHGLGVTIDGAQLIDGVTLRIDAGETLALMGANGSGKSSLVKALLGIYPATAGESLIFGHNVATERRRLPWQRVGYAPQRAVSTSGTSATALEVVATGLLGGRRLRLPRRWRDAALAALAEVSLTHRANDPVHVFSGGQQQRVLIARALVRNPDFLVLDEPLAGIDRASKDALADTLDGLHARGITMLIVLHDLGPLAPLIDRAVVMRQGRLVYDGAPPRPASDRTAEHDHIHAHELGGETPAFGVPELEVRL